MSSWVPEFITACQTGDAVTLEAIIDANQLEPKCSIQRAAFYYYLGLKWAASMGHRHAVRLLLRRTTFDIVDHVHCLGNDNILMSAAKMGHTDVVRLLIDYGFERINCHNGKHGLTALSLAAQQGHIETVEMLLKKGARPFINDALVAAASNGQTRMVELLLKRGARIESVFNDATALIIATRNCHISTVEVLLAHGASIKANIDGETTLRAAIRCTEPCRMLEMLANDYHADLEEADSDGETLLMFACRLGYFEAAKTLLRLGANVQARKKDGCSALIYAANLYDSRLIEFLVTNGADVNATDNQGNSALTITLARNCLDLASIKILLEHGANLEAANNETGSTPLILAAIKGAVQIVAFLLEKGADTTAKHTKTYTALMLASALGHQEIVQLLLKSQRCEKDDIDAALLFAAYNGKTVVVGQLLDAGADIETRSSRKGSTPLLLATLKGHIETVRFLLLQRGANLEATNYDGFTALKCVLQKQHSELFELFVGYCANKCDSKNNLQRSD